MATIGSLTVNLKANINEFSRPITRATALLGKFGKVAEKVTIVVGILGSALAAAFAAAAIYKGIMRVADAFKEVGELAKGTITETSKAIKEMGLALDDTAVRAIVRANKAVLKLKATFSAFFRFLAAEFAPLIEAIAGKITNVLANRGAMQRIAKGFFNVILAGVKKIADMIQLVVQTALKTLHMMQELLFGLRASSFGKKIGVGFDDEGTQAYAAVESMNAVRQMINDVSSGSWSDAIQQGMDNIMESIGKNQRKDFFKQIWGKVPDLSKATGGMLDNIRKWNNQFNIFKGQSLGKLWINRFFGGVDPKKATKTTVQKAVTPTTENAALRAGTREAFMASRKNMGETVAKPIVEIGKKQVTELQGIRVGIDKIAQNNPGIFSIPQ